MALTDPWSASEQTPAADRAITSFSKTVPHLKVVTAVGKNISKTGEHRSHQRRF